MIKYFETGDTKYVKLYEITDQEKPPNYILSWIDFLIDEGNSEENFNNYMGHHLPVIVFLLSPLLLFQVGLHVALVAVIIAIVAAVAKNQFADCHFLK